MARSASILWLLAAIFVTFVSFAAAHERGSSKQSFVAPEWQEYYRNDAGRVEILSDWWTLRHANLAAAAVTLQPNTLALPAYYDLPILKYVIKGNALASLTSPIGLQSNVKYLEKGDVLAVPKGWTLWIWNNGTEELKIVGVAKTSERGINSHEASTFHLIGGKEKNVGGLIHGFSKEVLARAWDVQEDEVKQLREGQEEVGFIKVPKEDASKLVWQQSHPLIGDLKHSIRHSDPDVFVKNGGVITTVNSRKLQWLGRLDLSLSWGTLEEGALWAPHFTSAWRLLHFINGKGRIEIAYPDGSTALQTDIQAGSNIVVPALFPVTVFSSENEKLEWVSFANKDLEIPAFLAGYNSIYHSLPWEVLKHGFKVEEKLLEKVYHTHRQRHEVAIFPRSKSGAKVRMGGVQDKGIFNYEAFVEAVEHKVSEDFGVGPF